MQDRTTLGIAFMVAFTLLGGLFLGEVVGMRRIAACAVGFGGAHQGHTRPQPAAFI